ILVHAKVPLLGHHTSGVRKEWYRTPEELAESALNDPGPKLKKLLLQQTDVTEAEMDAIEEEERIYAQSEFDAAVASPEPDPATVADHVYVPTPVTAEKGDRSPQGR